MLKGVYGPPRRLAAGKRLAPLPAPHTAKPRSTSRSHAHNALAHTTTPTPTTTATTPSSRRTKTGQTQGATCLTQVHQTASATTATTTPSPTRLRNSAGAQPRRPTHTTPAARVCSATMPCTSHAAEAPATCSSSSSASVLAAPAQQQQQQQRAANAQRPPMPRPHASPAARTRSTTRTDTESNNAHTRHAAGTAAVASRAEGGSRQRGVRPTAAAGTAAPQAKRASLSAQARAAQQRRSVAAAVDAARHVTSTSSSHQGRRSITHQTEEDKTKASANAQEPELALAKHDMDMDYHRSPAHWETRLTPLVSTLLQGNDLEPPYTTFLWTQAYADPPAAAAGSCLATSTTNNANESVSEVRKRNAALHRYAQRWTAGYYACVRCGNPVCAPRWQCRAESTRAGYAVFARMHRSGLLVSVVAGRSLPRQRTSLLSRMGSASLAIVVRCACCQGCMGHMDHLDDAPHDLGQSEESAASGAVFVVNSACLTYVHYRTAADLDATCDMTDAVSAHGIQADDGRCDDLQDGDEEDMMFDELAASFDSYRSVSSSSSSSSSSLSASVTRELPAEA